MAFDKTLFEKNFDFHFKATVANNIRIATQTSYSWMNEEIDCVPEFMYENSYPYSVDVNVI